MYVNQSKNSTDELDYGTYTYSASVKDIGGNENLTEERSVTIGNATPPSGSKFAIENSSGDVVASFDSKGDIYLRGSVFESQGILSPSANSFILQNVSKTVISYVNESGYLFLLGVVTESSDLSGLTSSNLEFRNSTNDLIAFFDNLGNLKLRGSLAENYGNP